LREKVLQSRSQPPTAEGPRGANSVLDAIKKCSRIRARVSAPLSPLFLPGIPISKFISSNATFLIVKNEVGDREFTFLKRHKNRVTSRNDLSAFDQFDGTYDYVFLPSIFLISAHFFLDTLIICC